MGELVVLGAGVETVTNQPMKTQVTWLDKATGKSVMHTLTLYPASLREDPGHLAEMIHGAFGATMPSRSDPASALLLSFVDSDGATSNARAADLARNHSESIPSYLTVKSPPSFSTYDSPRGGQASFSRSVEKTSSESVKRKRDVSASSFLRGVCSNRFVSNKKGIILSWKKQPAHVQEKIRGKLRDHMDVFPDTWDWATIEDALKDHVKYRVKASVKVAREMRAGGGKKAAAGKGHRNRISVDSESGEGGSGSDSASDSASDSDDSDSDSGSKESSKDNDHSNSDDSDDGSKKKKKCLQQDDDKAKVPEAHKHAALIKKLAAADKAALEEKRELAKAARETKKVEAQLKQHESGRGKAPTSKMPGQGTVNKVIEACLNQ
eukprot:jgi/Mesvir1/27218/Mv07062-RA.1